MTYHLAEMQLLPLFSVHFLVTFNDKLTCDATLNPLKDEAQTALFKDPVRTAL